MYGTGGGRGVGDRNLNKFVFDPPTYSPRILTTRKNKILYDKFRRSRAQEEKERGPPTHPAEVRSMKEEG